MKNKRNYHSNLRQEQSIHTREQILNGLIQAMAHGGLAELSVPSVARAAGVSVPTIYRYFPTKRQLIESISGYIIQKSGIPPVSAPRNPEELITLIKLMFKAYEGTDEMLRAAAMSELSYEMRTQVLSTRLKFIEDALQPIAGNFGKADLVFLRNIVFILTTTATIRAFKDYLNLSGDEAAKTVEWAIRSLVRGSPPESSERESSYRS